ncbi:MAG TPA: lysoplasmalogenase [Vicinamibacteria bacterium]|nr:lysoplasmalogenase [Vicinamibacteria bacterium]
MVATLSLPYMAAAAVTGLGALALLVAEWRDSRAAQAVIKPLASLGFVVAALAQRASSSSYGRALLVAFALCWLGDVLLISRGRRGFRAGILAFLLGHLAFVAAFLIYGVDTRAAGAALAVTLVAGTVVGRWLLPRVPLDLKPAVIAYVVVISIMVAIALGTGRPPIALGAGAFYLSDLSVARDRFVAPGFVNRAWGLPLYYGAQLVLAATPGL